MLNSFLFILSYLIWTMPLEASQGTIEYNIKMIISDSN